MPDIETGPDLDPHLSRQHTLLPSFLKPESTEGLGNKEVLKGRDGAPLLGRFSVSKTIIPEAKEHFLTLINPLPRPSLRWIRAKDLPAKGPVLRCFD